MKPNISQSVHVISIVLLLVYSQFIVAGKVYKWTDENGHVHFEDKPPQSDKVGEVNTTSTDEITNTERHSRAGEANKRKRSEKSGRTIKLPDGSEYPAPTTEAEVEALRKALLRPGSGRSDSETPVPNVRIYLSPRNPDESQRRTPLQVSHGGPRLAAKPARSSFGDEPSKSQIKIYDGELEKREGIIGYDAVERPITAEKVFAECNPKNLKPGTHRSGLCDLWDEHLRYLSGRLEQECASAGERIYKTVSNVDGIFLKDPRAEPNSPGHIFINRVLHEVPSQSVDKYMSPRTARLYRQFESYDNRNKAYVTKRITGIEKGVITSTRSHIAKLITEKIESAEPRSRYEVSYKYLTTEEDHKQGFYGDLTWVKDRVTNETLAERTIYYFNVKRGIEMEDGTRLEMPGGQRAYGGRDNRHIYFCEDYLPRATRFEKYHPEDEYEFVSRVLIPTPFTQDENNFLYDFSVGNGEIKRDCVGMQTVGPGITPVNLRVTRLGDDLKLSFEGGVDSLTCRSFFRGPHWDLKLMFIDGLFWNEEQVLDHGNIVREK